MKQQRVDGHGGRVIECIRATVKRVLDHGGTPDTAVQTALAEARQVQQLAQDKGTDDVDSFSEAVLEQAFGATATDWVAVAREQAAQEMNDWLGKKVSAMEQELVP